MILDDLSDDCLIEVLDLLSPGQLFKMQRLNKRMKRLAEVKMRTNIKAITWIKENKLFSHCHDHLGSSSRNQLLFLKKFKSLRSPWIRALFLNLLTKCSGVKSIEFVCLNSPGDILLEVVRFCPELECIKLVDSVVKEDEWEQILNQIGPQLIHFEVRNYFKYIYAQNRLLAMVAAKCANIKRVDWLDKSSLTNYLVTALKKLPKSCWVTVKCSNLWGKSIVDDVIDDLIVNDTIDLSMFDHRINRLSKLTFSGFRYSEPLLGVEFAGLKTLAFNSNYYPLDSIVNCLAASRFPRLEEFCFNANCKFSEDDFETVFQRMKSVKKLTIWYELRYSDHFLLPQSSIRLLEKLNTIVFYVFDIQSDWEPNKFIKQLEQFVDGIRTLKKLTVWVFKTRRLRNEKTLVNGVKQMNLKQNRVEIDLLFQKTKMAESLVY